MQREHIDLRQHPANAAISSTHQDPEGIELLKQPQTATHTHTQRCELACQTYCVLLCFCLCASVCVSPQVRPSIHQVKHLRRVQQLLEAPQELHTLIVSTFRVNKDQQRTGAGRRTRRLPETCAHNTHTHQLLVCRGLVGHWFVSTSCRPTWAVLALMLHTLKPL